MKNNYDKILNRAGNGSMKWEEAYIKQRFHTYGEKQYPLFIADMDYALDAEMHEAFEKRYKEPDFGYFHIQDSFYESVMEWYQKTQQIAIEKEWILPTIGTMTSLNIACDIFARGEGILVMTPVYGAFKNCMQVGVPQLLPLLVENNQHRIDFEGLESLCKQGSVKCVLFCHPHNPGGRVWSYDELAQLVDICKRYDVYLFSDEIHSDIIFGEERFVSAINFAHIHKKILVSTSANKTFNISGLNSSYMLCRDVTMRQELTTFMDRLHLSANRIGIEMHEICYRYGYNRIKELEVVLQQHIQLVNDQVQDLNIEVMKPESGYLMWMKLQDVHDIDKFVLDLAKATNVYVESGSRFIADYEQWIRINIATSTTLLEEAMKLFHDFYQTYKQ